MFLVLVMVMMLALVLQQLTKTQGMMILLMIDLVRLVLVRMIFLMKFLTTVMTLTLQPMIQLITRV